MLCRDGTRAPLDNAAQCHLGVVASHIVMASAATGASVRQQYKELLTQIDADFGINGKHSEILQIYSSQGLGRKNVMFSDMTKTLEDVALIKDAKGNPRDTYYSWVGK